MSTSDYLKSQSARQLLQLTGAVIDELVSRDINRTGNNPLSDYTEWLVARCLGLKLASTSTQGYDAIDDEGRKYEIKGRRITPRNKSRQLSAIRDIDGEHFDFLIAVVFDAQFEVYRAFKIPRSVVKAKGKYKAHTNSIILHARDSLLTVADVVDLKSKITE